MFSRSVHAIPGFLVSWSFIRDGLSPEESPKEGLTVLDSSQNELAQFLILLEYYFGIIMSATTSNRLC